MNLVGGLWQENTPYSERYNGSPWTPENFIREILSFTSPPVLPRPGLCPLDGVATVGAAAVGAVRTWTAAVGVVRIWTVTSS